MSAAPADGALERERELAAKAAFVEHFCAGWAGGRETLLPRPNWTT